MRRITTKKRISEARGRIVVVGDLALGNAQEMGGAIEDHKTRAAENFLGELEGCWPDSFLTSCL